MRLSIFLTFGLILVSSRVGEGQSLGPSLAPASAPGSGPSPSPSPSPASVSPTFLLDALKQLRVGFYKGKCANVVVDVEAIIMAKIQQYFAKDPTLLPALLRLQFHDCFVSGCDASLLISGPSSEQTAGPNGSVRGFDVIEAIKTAVEAECPGVVSCADITALATAFVLQLGGGPTYAVETGRRDGLESVASKVDLPSPTMTVAESTAFFAVRNFTQQEMVVLLGCHTVGITHCKIIQDRLLPSGPLYDPLMDKTLNSQLQSLCPQGSPTDNIIPLNQDTTNNNTVDNTFYNQLILNRGVLSLDQALARDPETSGLVKKLSLKNDFFKTELAKAMIKLQAFQVLTGDKGNIRTVCGKLN